MYPLYEGCRTQRVAKTFRRLLLSTQKTLGAADEALKLTAIH